MFAFDMIVGYLSQKYYKTTISFKILHKNDLRKEDKSLVPYCNLSPFISAYISYDGPQIVNEKFPPSVGVAPYENREPSCK